MASFFSAAFFQRNRDKLKAQTAVRPIIITATSPLQRNGDNTYPFRQDSNFWYLTGIDDPAVILVIDDNNEYLIVPDLTFERVAFDGAIEKQHVSERSGIKAVYEESPGWERLTKELDRAKDAATLLSPDVYDQRHGFYTNPSRRVFIEKLKDINPQVQLVDLRIDMARLRMVKQTAELKAIQEAITITEATLQEIFAQRQSYKHEYEIEADLIAGFRRRGAMGNAFASIVASGRNAATIHWQANNSPLDPQGLLCLDVGAEVENYAADITRTIALGKPSQRQQAVYDAVKRVHQQSLQNLRPGVSLIDNERATEQWMGKELRKLGLIKKLEHAEIRHYYPHATSHFLGLDPHDAGDYEQPLEANMVVTVEPGIYIPEEGIGVRIEDDILITKNGTKVLSTGLPHSLL